MNETCTDLLIVGGGIGGCAAALAATRAGLRVILTEETDWIGGQFTAQAVPPDEHGWIERFGCTASYRRFRDGIRAYYRAYYPLTDAARRQPFLNPGNGWVSPLCHEPRVALAVLESMLRPAVEGGRLALWLEHRPVAAHGSGEDRIRSVTLRDLRGGGEKTAHASYFLDATELGDLLPLTGTEFVTGAESRSRTGEPGAGTRARPDNMQAVSVCFAVEHREGEVHTIERPSRYEFWRRFVPSLDPPWPGPLLGWQVSSPRTLQPVTCRFHPHGEEAKAFSGLWTYRRLIDRTNFAPGRFPSDLCLINWPMIDYWLEEICCCSGEERQRRVAEARQLSLSLLYWLQTEAPRPDGGEGWPGLRLRPDVVGSPDGLAKCPYVRESRRIQAKFTVLEQHVSAAARPGCLHAERFADSVGIGSYRIDLHPTTGGDNYVDVESLPFQIPLGALVPVRVENVLPAAKNIGTTHITNGCYRVHPVEWNIGEAAGALAAFCLRRSLTPGAVCGDPRRRLEFQEELAANGVELEWPERLVLAEGDPHRHMSQPAPLADFRGRGVQG